MMPEYKAMVLDEIVGTMATDDGSHILAKFVSGTQPIEVAMPTDTVASMLLSGLARDVSRVAAAKGATVFSDASWFDLSVTQDGKLVLTFTFGDNAKMAFGLDKTMAERLFEVLGTTTGALAAPKSDKAVN